MFSISPHTAARSIVTISDKFFSSAQGENSVNFNGIDAWVLSHSSDELAVLVPDNVQTGPLSVTVNGLAAANQPIFTIPLAPVPKSVVSSVSPV